MGRIRGSSIEEKPRIRVRGPFIREGWVTRMAEKEEWPIVRLLREWEPFLIPRRIKLFEKAKVQEEEKVEKPRYPPWLGPGGMRGFLQPG